MVLNTGKRPPRSGTPLPRAAVMLFRWWFLRLTDWNVSNGVKKTIDEEGDIMLSAELMVNLAIMGLMIYDLLTKKRHCACSVCRLINAFLEAEKDCGPSS